MTADPRRLKPGELCQLLNSTPLGPVIDEPQLRRHRTRAGMRIGDGKRIDLLRYVGWLIDQKNRPNGSPDQASENAAVRELMYEAALGAAGASGGQEQWHESEDETSDGLTSKQQELIAALLSEPTYQAAAEKAGVGRTTLYRWLRQGAFQTAYRQARRTLVDSALGRMQAATGQSVATLVEVARSARRDSDRVRASIAILDYALRDRSEAPALPGQPQEKRDGPLSPGELSELLSGQMLEIDRADLPLAERSRLAANLANTLLRALGMDVLDRRLQAIESVLLDKGEDEK